MPALRNDTKAAAMYALYQQGYSLAQVAEAFEVTRQGAYKMFALRGWPMRDKPRPLPFVMHGGRKYTMRNTGYYGATDGQRELLHRVIWAEANGPIPEGYEVHHKDHDRTHNKLSNYELLTKADHARLHPGRQNQHTVRNR